MDESIKIKIEDFLRGLNTEVDVLYHVDIEDIDLDDPYDSIYDMIENGNGFDIEIIYYSRAMEYLSLNDTSLRESLEIADEMGYTPGNLNSEILASLLASKCSRDVFADLQTKINKFFEAIKEEIEALEENEEEDE